MTRVRLPGSGAENRRYPSTSKHHRKTLVFTVRFTAVERIPQYIGFSWNSSTCLFLDMRQWRTPTSHIHFEKLESQNLEPDLHYTREEEPKANGNIVDGDDE